MKVELDRRTENSVKFVRLNTDVNETAQRPETVRAWINMLLIAERWLLEGKAK